MFCSHCGKPLSDPQGNFCNHCGANLKAVHDTESPAIQPAVLSQLRQAKRIVKVSKRFKVGCLLFMAIFLALMMATAGYAIVPVMARLTAPLVCPADYAESVVVLSSSSHYPGQIQYSSKLYCIDKQHRAHDTNKFMVMLMIFLESLVGIMILFLLLILRSKVRSDRPKRPRPYAGRSGTP